MVYNNSVYIVTYNLQNVKSKAVKSKAKDLRIFMCKTGKFGGEKGKLKRRWTKAIGFEPTATG